MMPAVIVCNKRNTFPILSVRVFSKCSWAARQPSCWLVPTAGLIVYLCSFVSPKRIMINQKRMVSSFAKSNPKYTVMIFLACCAKCPSFNSYTIITRQLQLYIFVVLFHTTLFNNTLYPDWSTYWLKLYRNCSVRRVITLDPCVVFLRWVPTSHHNGLFIRTNTLNICFCNKFARI